MVVVVIYAEQSKIIRRILVSDTQTSEQLIANAGQGEAALEVDFDTYSTLNDADLRLHVAKNVGVPLHSGRCVELTNVGQVLGSYFADPDIDPPLRGGVLEVSDVGGTGDIKLSDTGEFISMEPVVIPNKEKTVVRIMAFDSTATAAEAAVKADATIAEANAYVQKQQQAAAQAGVVAPVPIVEAPPVIETP